MSKECIVCGNVAQAICNECGDGFCGAKCFTKIRHKYECPLIEARKRKAAQIVDDEDDEGDEETEIVVRQKRGHDLCEGETDPFTLEEFNDIPDEDIIVIDGKCFHLPSLYKWIIVENNNRNPLTNVDFSVDNLNQIREAGNAVQIEVILEPLLGGEQKRFFTSKFNTIEALILQLYPEWNNSRTDTVYQFLKEYVNWRKPKFSLEFANGSTDPLTALETMAIEQIFLRVAENTLFVYVQESDPGTIYTVIARIQQTINIAQARRLPLDIFRNYLRHFQRRRDKLVRLRRQQEELNRLVPPAYVPTAEDDENREEGTIKVGFKISFYRDRLHVGEARGVDYLYVNPDMTIRSALEQLRAIFRTIGFQQYIPDQMDRVIYGGLAYNVNMTFRALLVQDIIRDGAVFYVVE